MTFVYDETIKLPFGTLAKQEAGILLALREESTTRLKAAQQAYNLVDAALAYKYGQQAREECIASGTDAGVAQFDDNGVRIIVDRPRRVEWNQVKLAGIVAHMTAQGADPSDFVSVRYSVDEAKYRAWSSTLQSSFAEARKVVYEQPRFRLELLPEPAAMAVAP